MALPNRSLKLRRNEEALLTFSQAIATANDKESLLNALTRHLQPFYEHSPYRVAIFEPDQQHLIDWCTPVTPTAFSDHTQPRPTRFPFTGLIEQWVHTVEQANAPQFYSLDEAGIAAGQPETKEVLFTNLRVGERLLGFFSIDSARKGLLAQADHALFQAVADLVAAGVARIIDREELVDREREKSVLLTISTAIATISDKQKLLALIVEKIKPLFHFHDCGLFVFDPTKQYLEDLTVRFPTISTSTANQRLAAANAAKFLVTGLPWAPLLQRLVATGEPLIHNYQTDKPSHWDDYVQAAVMEETGYQESLMTLLKTGGEPLGVFAINALTSGTFRPGQFHIFQAITDQLAVALANVLAQEEILERDRQKSLLLAINDTIIRSTTIVELMHQFDALLRPVFHHADAGLEVVSQDGLLVTDYYALYADDIPSTAAGKDLNNSIGRDLNLVTIPFPGSLIEYFMKQPPSLGRLADMLPLGYDAPYIEAELAAGLRFFLTSPLTVSAKTYGLLVLLFKEEDKPTETHLSLFSQVANTLSVAVANILANEEIRAREREKDLQLALTHALTLDGDWSEKVVKALNLLQPYIPFDYVGLCLSQGDKRVYQGFRQIGLTDYQLIDPEALQRMTGLAASTCSDQWQKIADIAPQCLVDDSFRQLSRRLRLVGQVADLFKLESTLLMPIQLPSSARLLIWLGSRIPQAYTPADLARFSGLMTAIRPSLENLLAFEEIRRLTHQLAVEKDYLQEELKTNYNFEEIIGVSEPLQHVFQRIHRVAPTDSTVLLEGETGTGKELFARAIHATSSRRDRVLVKVNCAALPAMLIESELFGHEKGAFTGAIGQRIGKFELAHGGTLFLDEIGEMPLDLQPKLLRALQEKEIERVGGRQPIRCDVRIIAATNRQLETEVAQGRFRQDLFYRLHVFAISLPPLRHRPTDVDLLASHFLRKFAKRFGRPARSFSASALATLQAYDWPGNIRELEHVVEQALILSESPVVELAQPLQRSNQLDGSPDRPTFKTWQQAERDNILAVLRFTNGRIRGQSGAAELLGLNASTLDSRMKMLGISKSFGPTD